MPGQTTLPLRDIHLPANVGWWPPAPGWWLVAGLVVLALLLLAWRIRRRGNRHLYQAARQELQHIRSRYDQDHDERQLIQAVSIWLRRVCISRYPAADVAGLTGRRWLQFLDQSLGDRAATASFSDGPGRLLLSAPYQNTAPANAAELLPLCETWLNAVSRHHRNRP